MKEVPSNPENTNIYCTAADSTLHARCGLQREDLLRQIKVSALLGEHVYVSAGHVYENPETLAALEADPVVLASGIVAVGLRSDCRDFADLAELRRIEGKTPTDADHRATALLNRECAAIIRWHPSNNQPLYKRALLAELSESRSTLRRRMTAIKRQSLTSLIHEIELLESDQVRRSVLSDLARRHIPHRHAVFMEAVNLFYYAIGSKDKNLIPYLRSGPYDHLRALHSLVTPRNDEHATLDECFASVMKELLLPEDVLMGLPVARLAVFRDEHRDLLDRFRRKWWSIVSLASASPQAQDNLAEQVRDALIEQAHSEAKRLHIYHRTSGVLGVSSLLMSFVGMIPDPTLAGLSLLLSVGSFAADRGPIKHRIAATPFAALSSAIRSARETEIAQQSARAYALPRAAQP